MRHASFWAASLLFLCGVALVLHSWGEALGLAGALGIALASAGGGWLLAMSHGGTAPVTR